METQDNTPTPEQNTNSTASTYSRPAPTRSPRPPHIPQLRAGKKGYRFGDDADAHFYRGVEYAMPFTPSGNVLGRDLGKQISEAFPTVYGRRRRYTPNTVRPIDTVTPEYFDYALPRAKQFRAENENIPFRQSLDRKHWERPVNFDFGPDSPSGDVGSYYGAANEIVLNKLTPRRTTDNARAASLQHESVHALQALPHIDKYYEANIPNQRLADTDFYQDSIKFVEQMPVDDRLKQFLERYLDIPGWTDNSEPAAYYSQQLEREAHAAPIKRRFFDAYGHTDITSDDLIRIMQAAPNDARRLEGIRGDSEQDKLNRFNDLKEVLNHDITGQVQPRWRKRYIDHYLLPVLQGIVQGNPAKAQNKTVYSADKYAKQINPAGTSHRKQTRHIGKYAKKYVAT